MGALLCNNGTNANDSNIPVNDQDNAVGEIGTGFIIAIIIIGATGNLTIVITVLTKQKLRKLQYYMLIAALAFTDFMFNAIIMPFYIPTFLSRSYSFGENETKKFTCLYFTYFGTILLQASGLLLVCIACNRYMLVARVSVYQKLNSNLLYTVLQVVLIYALGFCGILPSVAGWDAKGPHYVDQVGRCNFDRKYARCTVVSLFCVGFVAPSALMMIIYALTLIQLARSHRRVRSAAASVSANMALETVVPTICAMENNGEHICDNQDLNSINISVWTATTPSNLTSSQQDLKRQQAEHKRKISDAKSFATVVTIFLAYMVTYLPFTLVNVLDEDVSLSREVYMYCSLLFWTGTCVNPLIYGVMNRDLRTAMKTLLLSLCNKCSRDS